MDTTGMKGNVLNKDPLQAFNVEDIWCKQPYFIEPIVYRPFNILEICCKHPYLIDQSILSGCCGQYPSG